MSEIRVLPLPKVTGIWRHDSSKYPDVIKVPMSDGTVVKYVIGIEQPSPEFLRDGLDKFTDLCVGYTAERKRRK